MTGRMLRRGLPRDLRATRYLLGFVIAAVVTILVTRGALAAAGYPQLGGHGLHIAHVLWGGLLLAVAVMMALSFVGPVIRPFAAAVGGIGFGLFLDEVGKFVTSTNNYFYRPALAIIYLTVVLIVLVIHWVHGRQPPQPAEYLASALGEAMAGSTAISEQRRERAMIALDHAGGLPGSVEAAALIRALPAGRAQRHSLLGFVAGQFRRLGASIVAAKPARVVTIALLCLSSAGALISTATVAVLDLFVPGTLSKNLNNVAEIGATTAAIVAAICVVVAVRKLRRDRRGAYQWFERAVLVDLLLTQVFVVATDQFSALPSTALDLVMLGVLGSAQNAHDRQRQPA